ncbi:hypothetical protein [Salininema proteolyticum]|uniref:Lipoprotein n=1 Tax=Salininema proteolyticum TaxID=1607685 RepID=A0ABV8U0F1_9ACTN
MKDRTTALAVGAAALLAVLSGCMQDPSFEERKDYLSTVSEQGAEVHDLIRETYGEPDEQRCEELFDALDSDAPDFVGISAQKRFDEQARQFFVDACLSGSVGDISPSDVEDA